MAKAPWVARPSPTCAAAWGFAALALLAGCSGSGYTVTGGGATGSATRGTTGRFGATSGGAGVAAGASGGSSSGASTGSGPGGPTGGSTGAAVTGTSGGSCQASPALTDCAPGQLELKTQVVAAPAETPLTDPVQFSNLEDPAQAAVTGTCGVLVFCLDSAQVVAPEVQLANYVTAIGQDVQLNVSEFFETFPIFQSSIIYGITPNLSPSFDATKATVVVPLKNVQGASDACRRDGWTFTAYDPDGGRVQMEENFTLGSMVTSEPGTSGNGYAILYNIDPAVQAVRVIGAQDAGASVDGGLLGCVYDGQAAQYTGFTHLQGGAVSSYVYLLAAPDGGA